MTDPATAISRVRAELMRLRVYQEAVLEETEPDSLTEGHEVRDALEYSTRVVAQAVEDLERIEEERA